LPGRLVLLAMCMAAAVPATAREVADTRLPAEILGLWLQDDHATFAGRINYAFGKPVLRNFDMRADIAAPIDVTGFETMATPRAPLAIRPVEAIDEESFARAGEMLPMRSWRLRDGTEFIATGTGRYAVSDFRIRIPRRKARPLDGRLTMKLDGKEESPVFSIRGGIAGAVWSATQPD
jgi:hypothetical protein